MKQSKDWWATDRYGSPSLCVATDVNTSAGEYWPTSSWQKMALPLDYLSEFFYGYCLYTYLYACKRISLDDHYFMVNFTFKFGQKMKKVGIAVQLTKLQNFQKR